MWVQISSGTGPEECCRCTYLFLKKVKEECAKKDIKLKIIDCSKAKKENTIKSVLLKLDGEEARKYVKSIEGSILWIWKSEYRPNPKRKNWFINVQVFDEEKEIKLNKKDIKIETMRCSGNGGQNVNKLETGVRITHLPTGIVVKAQEERSQFLNKKLALIRLDKELCKLNDDKAKQIDKKRWENHQNIKRGNPIRTFKGDKFKET